MAEHEDAAASWAIRLDAGPLDDVAQVELDHWLAQDPRASGALLRAQAALLYLDRARATHGSPQYDGNSEQEGEPEYEAVRRPHRRRFLAAMLAGGAVAAGLGAIVLTPHGEHFSTAVGEVRTLPLADGSTATINTASQLTVSLKPEQRQIALENGEAWFEVAHDSSRPFVVTAGDVRVRAVGTAFSVRRHEDGVDVLVTEGQVEIWRGSGDRKARLSAGERSFVRENVAQIMPVAAGDEIERALAWRDGGLALNGEPLSYAVAELNRYNRIQISIEDPVLNRTPIVGYFKNNNPKGFAETIAEIVNAEVMEGENIYFIIPSNKTR